MRLFAYALALAGLGSFCGADCQPVDFMTLALPQSGQPIEIALEYAYPGTDLNLDAGTFRTPDGRVIAVAPARELPPADLLNDATLADMFAYQYPLAFDLTTRQTAWFDPGRVRNEVFFTAMYFESEADARASLQTVTFNGKTEETSFLVTTRFCVASQLTAALAQIEKLSPDIDIYFSNPGGSFNWRVIAGTTRMSSHSFGTAIDINAGLGGYWRWTGATEGQVPEYENKIPQTLVETMERFGFIWGGKWNHFDGMHFEFRPELILFSRLSD